MTNLVSNIECLFWFFFQSTFKIRSGRSPIHSNLSLLSWGILIIIWRCPKFQNSGTVKKHNNNKCSKFDTKFVIWGPVEMTWSGHYSDASFKQYLGSRERNRRKKVLYARHYNLLLNTNHWWSYLVKNSIVCNSLFSSLPSNHFI